jgi:hypothetical protein
MPSGMRPWLDLQRLLAPVFWARLACFGLLFSLLACESRELDPLLTVSQVSPSRVELGENVEVLGKGFPSSRSAQLTFRGMVFRAGMTPESKVLRAHGRVVDGEHITIPVDQDFLTQFCHSALGERHTTFRGEVEVRFQGDDSMFASIYGTATNMVLDVLPPAIRREEAPELSSTLFASHGATVEQKDNAFFLSEIKAGSLAEKSGLAVGDQVVGFDGLLVHNAADFELRDGRSEVEIRLRRQGETGELVRILQLDRSVISAARETKVGAFMVIGLALLLLAIWGPPVPAIAHLAKRMKKARAPNVGKLTFLGAACTSGVPIVGFVLVESFDIAILTLVLAFLGASVLAMASELEPSSWRRWLTGMAFAGAWVLVMLIPTVRSGSLRIADHVNTQGWAPWEWHGFATPLTTLGFTVGVVATSALSQAPDSRDRATRVRLGAAALVHGVACGLLALAFLGGAKIPPTWDVFASPRSAHALGAVVLFGKSLGLAAFSRLLSDTLGRRKTSQWLLRRGLLLLLPVALGTVGLSWLSLSPHVAWLIACASFTLSAAFVLRLCVEGTDFHSKWIYKGSRPLPGT